MPKPGHERNQPETWIIPPDSIRGLMALFVIAIICAVLGLVSNLYVSILLRHTQIGRDEWKVRTPASEFRRARKLLNLAKTGQIPQLPVLFAVAGFPLGVILLFAAFIIANR